MSLQLTITCFGRQSYPTCVAVFTSGLSELFCNGLINGMPIQV